MTGGWGKQGALDTAPQTCQHSPSLMGGTRVVHSIPHRRVSTSLVEREQAVVRWIPRHRRQCCAQPTDGCGARRCIDTALCTVPVPEGSRAASVSRYRTADRASTVGGARAVFSSRAFLASPCGAVSPLHYDRSASTLTQVRGRDGVLRP
jgi:hypothetical protein